MNTRDIAKYILWECMDELSKMSISFKMHTLAFDYVMKGEY